MTWKRQRIPWKLFSVVAREFQKKMSRMMPDWVTIVGRKRMRMSVMLKTKAASQETARKLGTDDIWKMQLRRK
jgi:hypothetical protein